jgi:hypothetical protein
MKTTILTAAALLFASGIALAQTSNVQNDHTYSTHNYKHPNKAAEARRWEQKGATTVTPPAALPALANYKQPVPGRQSAGGVTIPTNGPASVASRNYKAGNSLMQSGGDTRSANRKNNRSGTDTSAVGDE